MTDDIRCTDSELRLLRPLDEMSTRARHAATRWLWQHDITPSTVAVGLPVERDAVHHVLTWREQRADGAVVKRWRFSPHDGPETWPAPFPEVLRAVPVGHDRQAERTGSRR